jgi:hypothetical protein
LQNSAASEIKSVMSITVIIASLGKTAKFISIALNFIIQTIFDFNFVLNYSLKSTLLAPLVDFWIRNFEFYQHIFLSTF